MTLEGEGSDLEDNLQSIESYTVRATVNSLWVYPKWFSLPMNSEDDAAGSESNNTQEDDEEYSD